MTPREPARSHVAGVAVDLGLRALSQAGSVHPACRRWRTGVGRTAVDVPYVPGAAVQRLDVWRPDQADGPLPVLLYLHGGGFRIGSKRMHWMFGAGYARLGFAVFLPDYRLQRHPGGAAWPNAFEDARDALRWVLDHAHEHGADPSRGLVVAGESAGANLTLALGLAAALDLDQPEARTVRALRPPLTALLPACGLLQVSRPERYLDRDDIPAWMKDRIRVSCRAYLPDGDPTGKALADPLCVLEAAAPGFAFPPVHAPVGGADPVLEDSLRLGRALHRLGLRGEVPVTAGAGHAFHAFVWSDRARACWSAQARFLAGVPAG